MNKKILIIFYYFIYSGISALASNYYWVNGSGNWSDYANHWANSSGGTSFHTQIPTPFDNVYFDANSFFSPSDSIKFDSTIINCRSMIWNGSLPVNIYSTTNNTLELYGSFILTSGLKWNPTQATIDFKSNSVDSIYTDGDTLVTTFTFSGSGQWNLLDNLNINSVISFFNGTFRTRGHSIHSSECLINSSNPGTLDLDTSNINCYSWNAGTFNFNSLTLLADRSLINCGEFIGGSHFTYNDVNVLQDFISYDSCSFNNVIFTALGSPAGFRSDSGVFHDLTIFSTNINPSHFDSYGSVIHKLDVTAPELEIQGSNIIDSLLFGKSMVINISMSTLTVNSYLNLNGKCGGLANFLSPDTGKIKMSSGIVNFNYVVFKNISAFGGATFNATNSINNGNVSGINITTSIPHEFYWVNGTGQWNDQHHWSTTSGGPGESCIPTKFDNVYFDINSFLNSNDTVYGDGILSCRSMYWNTINHPTFYSDFSSELDVYGSFMLDSSVNWDMDNAPLYFKSDTLGNMINTFGKPLKQPIYFEGNGEWNLQNEINLIYFNNFNFKKGILKTHGFKIQCIDFSINCTVASSIYLDTSTVICQNWIESGISPILIDADSSRIECQEFNSMTNQNYHDVICDELIYASNTHFNDVTAKTTDGDFGNFRNITLVSEIEQSSLNGFHNNANKVIVNANSCTIIGLYATDSLLLLKHGQVVFLGGALRVNNFLQATGGCDGLSYINGGIQLTGNGILDFLFIYDFTITGNAPLIASNSLDGGGDTGIVFVSSPTSRQLYWVNGTGNWNDVNHWAQFSGGPGGSCIPSEIDDIYFDGNSFNTHNDTIYANLRFMYARSMTWTDSATVFFIPSLSNYKFELYGSIKFCSGVQWLLQYNRFELKTYQPFSEISLSSAKVMGDWFISGPGNWFIQSPIYIDNSEQYLFRGTNIHTNGYPINNYDFGCIDCKLDTSHITCYFFNGTNVDADSSTIDADEFRGNTGSNFKTVNCHMLTTTDSCNFKNVFCHISASQNCVFENLRLKPGNYLGIGNVFGGSNNYIRNGSFDTDTFIVDGINTFDTMSFTIPGQEIDFRGSVIVNNLFEVNSNAGFPTRIQSVNGGTLSKSTDTVCIDNVYLKNIHVIGGAQFFSGNNSVDLGGNSGWVFSTCPLVNTINETESDFVTYLYPNPSSGNITIEFQNEKNETFNYSLTNISGQKLIQKEIKGSSIVITKGNLPDGVYFLSLGSKYSTEQFYKKIIFN